MTALWTGTPFSEFATQSLLCPTHRLAYYMGQIDSTIHEVFGVDPESEHTPDEARQVALLMMGALSGKCDQAEAAQQICSITAAWRAKRSVN